jgi:hypothetical protein
VTRIEGTALQMACAIDEGVVLRMTRAGDLVATTREALDRASSQVGGIRGLIAFNCLGRYIEAEARGLLDDLGRVYEAHPVVGFNTYGEQYYALHMNHTLTGLALGGGG